MISDHGQRGGFDLRQRLVGLGLAGREQSRGFVAVGTIVTQKLLISTLGDLALFGFTRGAKELAQLENIELRDIRSETLEI